MLNFVDVEHEDVPADLWDDVAVFLEDYGLTTDLVLERQTPHDSAAGARVVLSDRAGRSEVASIVYMPVVTTAAIHRHSHMDRVLVVGRRIHGHTADALRGMGIWFIDGAGNAYIRGNGLTIDVRGRRLDRISADPADMNVRTANAFSPRRAQVVTALLADLAIVDATYREIARRSGVSVGMAKNTIDALEDSGFVDSSGSKRRVARTEMLMNAWLSAYSGGLHRSTKLLVARGEKDGWSIPDDVEAATSGESAVPQLIRHPQTLDVYVRTGDDGKVPPALMAANRWRRDHDGDIVLRRMFWRDLPGMGDQPGGVPSILVYGDLVASREARQLEVAADLRETDAHLSRL